jgi:histidine triad (HIT) family protein
MTLFERIAAREIPAEIVFEDDHVVAFKDITPVAPIHILIVPKKAIPRIGEAKQEDSELLARLLLTSRKIAQDLNLLESGYRLVVNHGRDAGESVPHLHVHFLAGRRMTWPPG